MDNIFIPKDPLWQKSERLTQDTYTVQSLESAYYLPVCETISSSPKMKIVQYVSPSSTHLNTFWVLPMLASKGMRTEYIDVLLDNAKYSVQDALNFANAFIEENQAKMMEIQKESDKVDIQQIFTIIDEMVLTFKSEFDEGE